MTVGVRAVFPPPTYGFGAIPKLFFALFLVISGSIGTLSMSNQFASAQETNAVCPQELGLINGGFEEPALNPGGVFYLDPDAVPGWETDDSRIEIWRDTGASPGGSGGVTITPHSGSQYAEINYRENGTLSQDLDTSTLQGRELSWSFAHRGRMGEDTMALLIGPPGEEVEIGRFTTDNTGWAVYSGTYNVPEGQTETRFAYRAISTASGNTSTGNFVDSISFGVPPCDPQLELEKTSSVEDDDVLNVGDTITYTFTVENTGNVDIDNVRITDELDGLGDVDPELANIPQGESATFTAELQVTEEMISSGQIENTATATGDSPEGFVGEPPSAEDTVTINTQNPELQIVKSASPSGPFREGNVVTYTFEVHNSGNVPISNVTIQDPMPNLTWITGPGLGTLDPGEQASAEATYIVTAEDVTDGSISNSATVTGQPPNTCVGDCDPTSPPSETTVTTSDDAAIMLEKLSNVDVGAALEVGDEITYFFIVKNTGTVPLTDVSVSDALPGLSNVEPASIDLLQPEELVTFEATYVVTESDAESGVIINTATASGTPPEGPAITAEDSTMVPPVAAQPRLEIDKVPSVSDGAAVGDEITYTFNVTNSGNIDMVNVSVDDPLPGLSPIDPPSANIARGETVTFTATYEVQQSDVDAGQIVNDALAVGDCRDQLCLGVGSPIDEEIVTTEAANPELELVKSGGLDESGTVVAGESVTYTFVVTNTGNVTLTDVNVTDGMSGLSPIVPVDAEAPIQLAPTESVTFTATYEVTQADIDNGSIENTAQASGTPPNSYEGDPPVAQDDETVNIPQEPALEFIKSAEPGSDVAVGNEITYTFEVTNTGNVTLTGVNVTDEMPGLSEIVPVDAVAPITLAPTESVTFTATYVVDQVDVDSATINNSADATGTPPESYDGDPPIAENDETVTTVAPAPALSIVKTADPDTDASTDAPVTYTFTVENTGNVTLTNVTVSDPMVGLNWINGPDIGTLAPGVPVTLTAEYDLTEANLLAGGVENTATVTGEPPAHYDGDPPTHSSTKSITTVPPVAGLNIEKTAQPEAGVAVGDTVTYSFLVTNTGDVTLDDVTISDPLSGLTWTDGPNIGTLAPGSSATGTATYIVTEANLVAGGVENTATVTGTPPEAYDGDPPSNSSTEDITTVPAVAEITMEKRADPEADVAVGDTVTYTFLIQNTGNVTLTGVTIADPMEGLNWTNGPTFESIAPGVSVEGVATYTVTEADLVAGGVENTATVTGTPPEGYEGDPPSDSSTDDFTTVPAVPGVSIDKSADALENVAPGQTITYSFLVTNTGNVTLENVTISDAMEGLNWTNGPTFESIAPGESITGTATYTVSEADLLSGTLLNTASVTGNPPGELIPPSDDDTETITTVNPLPGISIDKSADPAGNVAPGQIITYSFLVTNTGNVTLDDVTITDAMEGLSWTNGPNLGSLVPGGSVTGTASYQVTEADLYTEALINTAGVTGTPPGELPPPSDEDTVTVTTVVPAPAIVVEKSADPASGVGLGETITYTFTVTNTGNVALSNVTIADPMEGLTWMNGPVFESLAPGETVTGSATYIVTQADVNAGGVSNSATVTGTPPGEETPPISPPSEVNVPIESSSGINMVKSVSPDTTIDVGETLTYTFVVTNTGATTITNVTVTDRLPGLSEIEGPHGTSLEPGESATFTATYVVTDLDGAAGMVMNTATGSATGSDGSELSSVDSVSIRACEVPGGDTTSTTDADDESLATPSASDDEEVDDPVDEGGDTPPVDEGGDTPPVDEGGDTPPVDEGGDTPPVDEGGDTPPVDEDSDTPPVDEDSDIPPVDEGGDTPPVNEGGDTPPVDEGGDTPPVDEGGDTPPVDEGGDTPPVDEGGDTPPANNPPAEDPATNDDNVDESHRVVVFGFQQLEELGECEPLPVDPAPQPPTRPGTSAPPVISLPSTGQGSVSSGVDIATIVLVATGLGIVLAAGTMAIRRDRA